MKAAGGLHKFMQWQHPLMTDSGGFQVFSLGFGKDFSTGKILKPKEGASIRIGQQPKLLRITDDGVHFTSFRDGKKIFLGPKESIRIQLLTFHNLFFFQAYVKKIREDIKRGKI